jgi:hypothetical protein
LERGMKHGEWLNYISDKSRKMEKIRKINQKHDIMNPRNFGINFIKILRKIMKGIKIYIIYNDKKYTQTTEI